MNLLIMLYLCKQKPSLFYQQKCKEFKTPDSEETKGQAEVVGIRITPWLEQERQSLWLMIQPARAGFSGTEETGSV